MKPFEVIRSGKIKGFQAKEGFADGGSGWVTIHGKTFFVIYSNGGGWEHVSMSSNNRCPTWEEMCFCKNIFFDEDECCIEYHPAKADYVNDHPYCLHIWKPIGIELPKPPTIMVGTGRKG